MEGQQTETMKDTLGKKNNVKKFEERRKVIAIGMCMLKMIKV